jgi:hypothetical protein
MSQKCSAAALIANSAIVVAMFGVFVSYHAGAWAAPPQDAASQGAASQGAASQAKADKPPKPKADGPQRDFNPRTVLGRAIRPIKNAPHVDADQIKGRVKDNDLVLGVVVEGEARAYPINLLCGPSREIINDQLGGTAIAATW